MNYKILLTLLIALSVSSVTGCSSLIVKDKDYQTIENEAQYFSELTDQVQITNDTVTFIDSLGVQTTIPKKPKRVISLYNSFLDLWYESGGEVIGRVEGTDKIPEGAVDIDIVGTKTALNLEKIISLEPDLVILRASLKPQADIIPILEENGIPYLAIDYNNFEEYLYQAKVFTSINDRSDLYEEIGVNLQNKIEDILVQVPLDKKPTVLLMFASSKTVTAKLPNTFTGDILADLGAINIAYDSALTNEEMEIFSMEKVIEQDPDFILVQTMGDVEEARERLIKNVQSNPAWNSLTAVKEDRYIFLPKDLYLYKPNTRYDEAYLGLAKILYPDIFE